MRQEWFARSLVLLLLAIVIATPMLLWWQNSQTTVIHARMAEDGGWTPDNLNMLAGHPLKLRLTSDDVTHGFAIGQSDQPSVDVHPGEMTELTLLFDRPGKYTFYCTRWCGVNHWRMRGVIDVTASPGKESTPESVEPPLYVQLGLDIDRQPTADVVPSQIPSAQRGDKFSRLIPIAYLSREYYLSHTPLELWKALRIEKTLAPLSAQQVWDVVAWVWGINSSAEEINEGQELYNTNCAACHGEQGRGDGVFSTEFIQPAKDMHTEEQTGSMSSHTVDFSDASHMLAVSPAHLQGKILRGGMGTGMPYWGTIFTDDQTLALVAYLWTFQFQMEAP